MESNATLENVTIDQVSTLLVEHGYEIIRQDDNVLSIKDVDSGIVINTVLEENILFATVTCLTVPTEKITQEIALKLLDAENGISTSAFQLYRREDETFALTLNNFCKLQAMGPDDHDDILSCLQFIEVDVYAARELLAGILG